MRGDTTAVNVDTLRMQWVSHSSMASICHFWTISKDQLIRLRDVYSLPKRHSRSIRFKPERDGKPPSKAEELASQNTLSLAPAVEKRAATVRAMWTDSQREARYWQRPSVFSLQMVDAPFDLEESDEDSARPPE